MCECYIGLLLEGFPVAPQLAEFLFRLLQYRNHRIGSLDKSRVVNPAAFALAQQEAKLLSVLDALFALLDGGQWVSLACGGEKDLEKGLWSYSRNWCLIFPLVL